MRWVGANQAVATRHALFGQIRRAPPRRDGRRAAVNARAHPPCILGLGGTVRPGSTTERALAQSLEAARAVGATTRLLGGEFLAELPSFDPRTGEITPAQREFIAAVRAADGLILATPGYHASVSGVVKNALDTLELTANDPQPYLADKPVGAIVTAYGWQAAGATLVALRSIIHALRGWPTPFGATLNTSLVSFDENGLCSDEAQSSALALVAEQVTGFLVKRR
jgi:FMN reductase